jgi:broad specificity phosphatase PhoE
MTGVLYLIRHGESVSNAEFPSSDPATIPLTSKGHEQSAQLAQSWSEAPDLIVVSPFVRARQTAMPLCERFPAVPVQVWPVQEFTFVNLKNAPAFTGEQREPLVKAGKFERLIEAAAGTRERAGQGKLTGSMPSIRENDSVLR